MPSPERRPRGRPRAFDPADKLALAAERFRTRGFAAASLDELAAATGLNRPSLYAAYGDKRALYLAALARAHESVEARLGQLAAAGLPLEDALARLFAATIHGFLQGESGPAGCLLIATAQTEAATDPDVRAALARFVQMEDRMLEELLAASGSPAPGPHARLVTGVIHSMSVRARAGEGREALERLARDCIQLVVG